MDIILPSNKEEPKQLPKLYEKALFFLERTKQKDATKSRIITFLSVFHTLGTMFHLSKGEVIDVFDELRRAGYLEVIPYRSLKLLENKNLEERD